MKIKHNTIVLFLGIMLFSQCQAINLKSIVNKNNVLKAVSISSGLIGAAHIALGYASLRALINLRRTISQNKENQPDKLLGKKLAKSDNYGGVAIGMGLSITEVTTKKIIPILAKATLLHGLILYSAAVSIPAITISAITGLEPIKSWLFYGKQ